MSKIFAGELIGEMVAGGELAAATGGLALPFEFLGLGVQGMIMGIRRHKHKKEDQRNQAAAEEQKRIEDEQARQMDLERIAREQEQQAENERLRLEEEQRQYEEQMRQNNERARQLAIDQRDEENKQDIQRAVNRDIQISDQLEADRQARLVNNYSSRSSRDWMRVIPRDQINGYDQMDIRRPGEHNVPVPYVRPPNPPNNDPAGGNNDPAGGNGDDPPPNPANPANNDQFYNYNPYAYDLTNPYAKLIAELARQIAENKNREKPQPVPENLEPNIIGGNGGTWQPEYWTDEYRKQQEEKNQSGSFPGQGGSGTWDQSTKDDSYLSINDDTHLIENELLAVLNAQGMSEQNQEMQIGQLQKIEQDIQMLPSYIPEQAQTSSIFSGTVSRH